MKALDFQVYFHVLFDYYMWYFRLRVLTIPVYSTILYKLGPLQYAGLHMKLDNAGHIFPKEQ